tara:strand:+ start:326 stop:679 length:354 start_codon:yes stop_codon:yes gene_type:complete
MPTYIIRDTKRRKEFDVFCSWSELQDFLKNNPHCIKVVTAAAVVGDHIKKKTDGGMKEVFSKIADKHPNSALADRFGGRKSNAAVKAKTIAKKHGLVKDGGQNLSKRFKKDKKTGLY